LHCHSYSYSLSLSYSKRPHEKRLRKWERSEGIERKLQGNWGNVLRRDNDNDKYNDKYNDNENDNDNDNDKYSE
jgi:hypothetical protein